MAMTAQALPITRPLRTQREYRAATKEIDQLLDERFPPGSPGDDRLDLLSVLVEAYENEHEIDLEDPTPREAVSFALEQRGLKRSVLNEILGSSGRVSEFFNGKRALSTTQIRALRQAFGIPADLLIE